MSTPNKKTISKLKNKHPRLTYHGACKRDDNQEIKRNRWLLKGDCDVAFHKEIEEGEFIYFLCEIEMDMSWR